MLSVDYFLALATHLNIIIHETIYMTGMLTFKYQKLCREPIAVVTIYAFVGCS